MNFKNFRHFYFFYLAQHQNRTNRLLHRIGTTLVFFILIYSAINLDWRGLPLALLVGYGFAWTGHFVFEKNRPATFGHPFYSLASDWIMWAEGFCGTILKNTERNNHDTNEA